MPGPREQPDRYRCSPPPVWWLPYGLTALVVVFFAGAFAHTLLPALAAAITFLLIGGWANFVKVDVELGPEGVTFGRLGLRRFLPYVSIASVEMLQRAGTPNSDGEGGPVKSRTVFSLVRFELRDGSHFDLGTGEHEAPPDVGPGRAGAFGKFGVGDPLGRKLAGAVRERLRELEAHEPRPASLERELARQGRDVGAWLSDLDRLRGPAGATYRVAAPVDNEQLFRVLENPAAGPGARAAAAVLLRGSLGPGDAPRARAVVERCASPRLRVALERALDDGADEAERSRALAELD